LPRGRDECDRPDAPGAESRPLRQGVTRTEARGTVMSRWSGNAVGRRRARRMAALAAAALALAFVAFWLATMPRMVAAGALEARAPDLANGRAMFLVGGCASCHATPNQNDPTRLGGGLALESPFGRFYVPNISSDPMDGIGGWSEAQFVTAMVEGVSPAGAHLYPALPYTSYQRMRLADLRDLFAYLKTLPPVAGRAPAHELRFPFNVRRLIGLWKLLFLDGRPFVPDPARSREWNRGAYLVNGPGHCAECHSPRNFLGAIVESRRFAGGPSPVGQGGVPSIRQDKLAAWTVDDFAALLATGATPDADKVGGAMAEVVRNTAQLSPADRRAMAVYLKSLPALR
jgi:mono/diheme cytochrome c family protein